MKKIIALALVLVFTIALAVPAFAATITSGGAQDLGTGGSTQVTYNVSGAYTVSVPATVAVNAEGTVNVKDVLLYSGTKLTVAVSYYAQDKECGELTHTEVETCKIAYKLYNGAEYTNEIANGTVILEVVAGAAAKGSVDKDATFMPKVTTPESEFMYAGVYTGTFTYNIATEEVNS